MKIEDFFITPMEGWRVRGDAISSVASAERALQRRAPEAGVTICHCRSKSTEMRDIWLAFRLFSSFLVLISTIITI